MPLSLLLFNIIYCNSTMEKHSKDDLEVEQTNSSNRGRKGSAAISAANEALLVVRAPPSNNKSSEDEKKKPEAKIPASETVAEVVEAGGVVRSANENAVVAVGGGAEAAPASIEVTFIPTGEGELKEIPGIGHVLETRSKEDGKVIRYPIATIGKEQTNQKISLYKMSN